jgi:glycosyltransferase involved in cell wall biosynthesis
MGVRAQVVIPAHEGADTLHRSIGALAAQRFDGSMHVVVAVNSDDGTLTAAERLCAGARRSSRRFDVITTPSGRRCAINEAEKRFTSVETRLYLDQDVWLSPAALQAIVGALSGGQVHFATGRARAAAESGAVGRAYCAIWRNVPYVRRSCSSMGMFAVSPAGRARWSELPDLASDDKYVRMHFAVPERVVVPGITYEPIAPSGIAALLAARRRYRAGNRQLALVRPDLVAEDPTRWTGSRA